MTRQILLRALVFYALALMIGSFQPARPSFSHHGVFHRSLHLVMFAVLAGLSRIVFRDRRWLLFIVMGCVAFGAALEWGEHAINHIPFEWDDLRDDTIGTMLGVACIAAFTNRDATVPGSRT